MASLQAHLLVFFLKLRVKRRMHAQMDVLEARKTLGGFKHKVPADLMETSGQVGGVVGEWLRRKPARNTRPGAAGTLFYLHGGGYFACSPQTHRPITGGFARRGFEVFAPDYRLAPEHPFPAAVDDAVAAYRGLLASGVAASQVVVGGDSAGGGLTMAMLLTLRDAGDALPAAAVLFSPWTDLAGTGETLRSNAQRDAMFPGEGIEQAAAPYLGGADPRNPLVSPLYGDLSGLPPILIHAGSYEVLLDDSRRLVERAQAAGTPATLATWDVVPHVWQLFPLPEAAQSMDQAAAFLLAAMRAPERLAA